MSGYCETHDQAHVSTCCGAQAIDDTDICAKCRDHTEFACPDCEDAKIIGDGIFA